MPGDTLTGPAVLVEPHTSILIEPGWQARITGHGHVVLTRIVPPAPRHAIGTGVIGGMIFATFLGLLLIPVFFIVVRRMLGDKLDEPSKEWLEKQGKGEPATH